MSCRSQARWSSQPRSWTAWWCSTHNGSKFARSVAPPCSHQRTWCNLHRSKGASQPGMAQVGYRARRALRWARLASRVVRPRSNRPGACRTSPRWTTTGATWPTSNTRRRTSAGSSTGRPQSTAGDPAASGADTSTTTTTSGRPARATVPPVRAARAWALRKPWRSSGSLGQWSGTCSANRASTAPVSRPWSRNPVSGSKRPARHHMPSPSTQVRNLVDRRCCSNRAMSSSRRIWRTSAATARRNSSGVDRDATSTSASARSTRAWRCPGSSWRRAWLRTSTCAPPTAPPASASSSAGIRSTVRARSSTRPASRNEVRAAPANSCSGNEATSANCEASCTSRPSSHARRRAADATAAINVARSRQPGSTPATIPTHL